MYRSLTIEGFRGFSHLEVGGLARVNLIVGDNGVGKTSLLEAIFLLCGHANPELAYRLRTWRGLLVAPSGAQAECENLFYGFRTDVAANISGTIEGTETPESLVLRLKPAGTQTLPLRVQGDGGQTSAQPPFMTRVGDEVLEMEWQRGTEKTTRHLAFYERLAGAGLSEYGMEISPPLGKVSHTAIFLQSRHPGSPDQENEQFSGIVQSQQRERMIEFLQKLDDRVQGVEILSANGGACVHVDIGEERMMQLGLMGDGLARAARLYLSATSARDGVLMVDEVGNGLHYSALADGFWSGLWDAVTQFNVQLFATTHSEECLRAAYEDFARGHTRDLAVHRLERVDGEIRCRSFDHATLGTALDSGFEVR